MKTPSRGWLDRVPFQPPAVWLDHAAAWRRRRHAWLRKACGPNAETARAFVLRARDLFPGEREALARLLALQAGEGVEAETFPVLAQPAKQPHGVRELRTGDLPGWDLRTPLRPPEAGAVFWRGCGHAGFPHPSPVRALAGPGALALLLSLLAAAAYQRGVSRAGREARRRLGAA